MRLAALFGFLFIMFPQFIIAQSHLKGYVFTDNDLVLFQPTLNDTNFFESLNGNAFPLGTIQERESQIEFAFKNIGDSIVLEVNNMSSKYYSAVHYFYAEIEVLFASSDNEDFQFFDKPLLCYQRSGERKCFFSWSINNRIIFLKASNSRIQRSIISFYEKRSKKIPLFLMDM